MPGFNEAAGIHRRKLTVDQATGAVTVNGFNEAAGIHRRKRARWRCAIGLTGSMLQ